MIYFLTVNYYSTELVAKLIHSFELHNNTYNLVIINNSKDDHSINNLARENVMLINASYNLGFGKACNLGLEWIYNQDNQALVWIINPDAYLLTNNWDKLELFFQSYPEFSIVGTIIHTPTGEVWFGGGQFMETTGAIVSQDLLKDTESDYIKCDWVSGCSMIINLSKFAQCPLFDSAYFLYYEDFDFCQRYAKQGHLIAITKHFIVGHNPSSTTNKNIFLKIKHSTYSYLLTLEKYTSIQVQIVRTIRLLCYAIFLLPLKPQIALGKLSGLLSYGKILKYHIQN